MESQNSSLTATTTPSSADSSLPTSNLSKVSSTTQQSRGSLSLGKNGTTLELIQRDLEFLFPIMIKFPKCYWLWNYRGWLLQQANMRLPVDIARELWARELVLVSKMLVKDSRNFHGWGYRRHVVEALESSALNGKSMVESEFEYTTRMVHAPNGLSNFSAWHRRSRLIPRLLDERKVDDIARRQFLDDGREPHDPIKSTCLTPDQNSTSLSPRCTRTPIHINNPRGSTTNS